MSRPQIDAARARALAAEGWGLEVHELRELDSYADRNFLLDTDAGRRVLKISSEASEPRPVLELQGAALRWLAERPSGARLPRVIPAADGSDLLAIRDQAGAPGHARVLSWISGTVWAERAPASSALRRELGRALAELDRDLEGFSHPAMARDFRWNLERAEWIAEHLELVAPEEPARRALVVDALAQFRARVRPRLAELPRQLIYGDANDHNLIVAGDRVVGIIDFGDTVEAPTICELAIALAYLSDLDDPLASAAELCAGYSERRPLAPLELDLLFDLVRARLAVSLSSSAERAAAEPDNAYLRVSEAPAWRLLGALSERGRVAFTKAVAAACGLEAPVRVPGAVDREALLERRRARLGPSLSLSYADPLYIRRGEGSWLFDEHERAYLDCVNNVCHVGHSHPRVVAAIAEQAARLNTNTRYLHEGIVDYAERLCATLPEPLSVVFLVCSGSEANELALRIARAHTGAEQVAVVDGAYHGNTSTLVDLSPYKFAGPGGAGQKPWVQLIPTPDPYRGEHGDDGPAYAAAVDEAAARARAAGEGLAALVCEPVLGCAGQIVPAKGFLAAAFERARAAGAVCIADEVQVGFGRVGDMWAFSAEGVVPDILTLGKPIANGHPVGAVVTTPQLAASFAGGMEYFNSFGGNPVSCAAARAVLEVIEDEGLIAHARELGGWLRAALEELDDPGVGEVRGRGLFLGVELVEDRAGKTPAPARARAVVEHARRHGTLLSVDGPAHNVIKIKPPLCFGMVEARILRARLAAALAACP